MSQENMMLGAYRSCAQGTAVVSKDRSATEEAQIAMSRLMAVCDKMCPGECCCSYQHPHRPTEPVLHHRHAHPASPPRSSSTTAVLIQHHRCAHPPRSAARRSPLCLHLHVPLLRAVLGPQVRGHAIVFGEGVCPAGQAQWHPLARRDGEGWMLRTGRFESAAPSNRHTCTSHWHCRLWHDAPLSPSPLTDTRDSMTNLYFPSVFNP